MDGGSRATFVFRVGTILIAVGLAFGLVAYMSSLTVSGYTQNARNCGEFGCYYGGYQTSPPGTYQVLMNWGAASPQQMYFINMTSSPAEAKVYLMATNQSGFYAWVSARSGLPLYNVSSNSAEGLRWFNDYISSHGTEVVGQYDVTSPFTVVRYIPPDVEPLMLVLTNANASPTNLTFTDTSVGITINPSLGYWVTVGLTLPGVAVLAVGIAFKRQPRPSV